jgi:hypothetical protein
MLRRSRQHHENRVSALTEAKKRQKKKNTRSSGSGWGLPFVMQAQRAVTLNSMRGSLLPVRRQQFKLRKMKHKTVVAAFKKIGLHHSSPGSFGLTMASSERGCF